jgi:hypothetical protein
MFTKYILYLILIILVSFSAKENQSSPYQVELIEINLNKKIAFPKAEFSGLDWYKGELILLPQYPDRFSSHFNGCLFSISKSVITKYLKNKGIIPINPAKIELDSKGIESQIEGFQGYEAIVFNKNNVYLSIEAETSGKMYAYIIKGEIDSAKTKISLYPESLKQIPLSTDVENMAIEALLISNNRVLALYEANGINVNKNPSVVSFDLDLEQFELLSFPNIEYRITDATKIDNDSSFWGINYMFKGEYDLLNPGIDSIYTKYNRKISDLKKRTVERLVKFKIKNDHIILEDIAPIPIKLSDKKDSRNWEGIVKYDSLGFLVITDRFPRSILAYIPFPIGDNDLFIFERDEKFGFKNSLEFEIIEPRYNYAQNFSKKGIVAVIDDSGWVYIDKRGEKIIRPHIVDNGPDYFSFGLARFNKNNRYGYFDESGRVKILPQFDYARSFSDSVAAVCKGCTFRKNDEHTEIINGKWGFINLKGDLVIPFIYDEASDFKNGHAKVKENGKSIIIDKAR